VQYLLKYGQVVHWYGQVFLFNHLSVDKYSLLRFRHPWFTCALEKKSEKKGENQWYVGEFTKFKANLHLHLLSTESITATLQRSGTTSKENINT